MSSLRVVISCMVLALAAAPAWGQYGLYGAPPPLDLSRLDATPDGGHHNPVAGPYQLPPVNGQQSQTFSTPASWAPPPSAPAVAPVRPVAEVPEAPIEPSPALDGPNGPTLVDQMLEDAGRYGTPAAAGAAPPGQAGFGGGLCATAPAAGSGVWYVYAAGLVMGRNEANRLWTTYEAGVPENQLMHTLDIGMPWHGGWEGGVGRIFGGGTWALEGTYWGLDSVEGSVSSRSLLAGLVSTPLIVGNIQFGTDPNDPLVTIYGTDLFDNAQEHVLRRRNEVHNIEINVVCNQSAAGCQPIGCNWSMGVRFFRFQEALSFMSLAGGYDWDDDGGARYGVLNDRVENNLIGFQLGCDLNWDLGWNIALYAAPSVGIYANQINHHFRLYRGDGVVAVPDPSTGITDTYPVANSDTDLSFLSQVDLGLSWAFDARWEAFIAYRVLFATGIALADHQIPTYVVDIPEIAAINSNGDLIYHGALVGVVCRF